MRFTNRRTGEVVEWTWRAGMSAWEAPGRGMMGPVGHAREWLPEGDPRLEQTLVPSPAIVGVISISGGIGETVGTEMIEEAAVVPAVDYSLWLARDMRTELQRRGLVYSGNKETLKARLEADDAEAT